MFLVRSLEEERIGWIAGALLGLGLAVGYEAIGLVVPALALPPGGLVAAAAGLGGVARAATAATAVLLAALVADGAAGALARHPLRCALAQSVLLAACCAAGLWAAMLGRQPDAAVRFAILGASGPAGGASTACSSRPASPARSARSTRRSAIWLDHVMESKSILWLAASQPAPALAVVGFVLAGAAAQFAIWRQRPATRAPALAAAFVVLAAVLGCWQIKLMPYASWLAVVPLAVWAAGLRGTATLSAPLLRVAAVALLSQATLEARLRRPVSAAPADRPRRARQRRSRPTRAGPASDRRNVGRLAALPPGWSPPTSISAPTSWRCRRTAWWRPPIIASTRASWPTTRSCRARPRRPCAAARARRQLRGAVRRPPGP